MLTIKHLKMVKTVNILGYVLYVTKVMYILKIRCTFYWSNVREIQFFTAATRCKKCSNKTKQKVSAWGRSWLGEI